MALGLGFEYQYLIIEYNWHVDSSLANGELKIYRSMPQIPGWWPRTFYTSENRISRKINRFSRILLCQFQSAFQHFIILFKGRRIGN